jgi:leader peptidase (prepilin peptidase)/N-methyltransferase
MDTLVAAVAGLVGLAAGSFANVVIHRVPAGLSVVRPPSRCPACSAPVRPRDNVPVLSWLVLRGRCRDCGAPIAARYPLVELLTAGLWVAAAVRFAGSVAILPYCLGFTGLVALAFIDLDTRLLPRRVRRPTFAATLAGFAVAVAADGTADDLQRALLGSLATYLCFEAIWWFSRLFGANAFGGGDVALGWTLGLLTGWVGRGAVAAGVALAFLLGSVAGLVLMATGRAGRRTTIPFGPFLCAGCVLAVLWPAAGRFMEDRYVGPLAEILRTLLR